MMQSEAFSLLFDPGELVIFQSSVNDCPSPYRTPLLDDIAHQFMVANPFIEGTVKRVQANVAKRKTLIIEADTISLDLQKALWENLTIAPTVVTFSGNKSYHLLYTFSEELTPDKWDLLVIEFKKLFPFCDYSVISDFARLCRTPNATRDNGNLQEICALNRRLNYQETLDNLIKLNEGISAIPNKANALLVKLHKKKIDPQACITEIIQDILACGYNIESESSIARKGLLDQQGLVSELDIKKMIPQFCVFFSLVKKSLQAQMPATTKLDAPRQAPLPVSRCPDSSRVGWIKDSLAAMSNENVLHTLQSCTPVTKVTTRDNSISLCCPFHEDQNPSSYIIKDQKDNIPKLHCSHCNFMPMDALDIIQHFQHISTNDACKQLFGAAPTVACSFCGQAIVFEQNRPYNLDGGQHVCNRPSNDDTAPKIDDTNTKTEDQECLDAIKPIPHVLSDFESQEIAKIRADLEDIKQNDILCLSMPTGTGKTYSLLRLCLFFACQGIKSAYFAATVSNANDAIGLIKSILSKNPNEFAGITEKDIGIAASAGREEKNRFSDKQEKPKIIVSSYGYVGRYGQSSFGFKRFHEMIEGRLVIFDEVQTLEKKMTVDHPLSAIYHRAAGDQQEYRYCVNCPKSAKMGDCESCIRITRKSSADDWYRSRDWIPTFRAATIEHLFPYLQKSRYLDESDDQYLSKWIPLIDNKGKIRSTLFFLLVEPQLQRLSEIRVNKKEGEIAYLDSLAKTLVNPHYRQEFPVDIEENRPISFCDMIDRTEVAKKEDRYEQLCQKIKFPKQACCSPRFCGFDSFVFSQLMGLNLIEENKDKRELDKPEKITRYQGAYAIIFASATFPEAITNHLYILSENGRFNKAKKICSNETVARFKVAVLSTECAISSEKQVKIARLFLNDPSLQNERLFIVSGKRKDARQVSIFLSHSHSTETEFFEEREFAGNRSSLWSCQESKRKTRALITYARSAITTGTNFPEYNISLIDLAQYIPLAGITSIKAGMTTQEVNVIIDREAINSARQCVGRPLRTTLEIVPGKTIDDPNQKIFIFHNLHLSFDVPGELCIPGTYQHVKKTWQSSLDVKPEDVLRAIKLIREGQTIPDFFAQHLKMIAEKKNGLLSKKQRAAVKEYDICSQARQERKESQIEASIEARYLDAKRAKETGKPFREICTSLHLQRYPELRERVRSLFKE